MNWSEGSHAGVMAGVESLEKDLNALAAVRVVVVIALVLENVLGFLENLPCFVQVRELRPGAGFGACGAVGSWS